MAMMMIFVYFFILSKKIFADALIENRGYRRGQVRGEG